MELLRTDITHTLTIANSERTARLQSLSDNLENQTRIGDRQAEKAFAAQTQMIAKSQQTQMKRIRNAEQKEKKSEEFKKRNVERDQEHEKTRSTRSEVINKHKKELEEWQKARSVQRVSADDIVERALKLLKELVDNKLLPVFDNEDGWQEMGFYSAADALVFIAREMADYAGSLL